MTYNINYTDSNNKPALVVEDSTFETTTDLTFPGRNVSGYGQVVAENFLHLLENFANTEPPPRPVEGQLWFDSNEGVNQLKVNVDGTPNGWQSAGGLKRGSSAPNTSTAGDLWVNTDTQQLYLYTGSGWILVGPRFSSGTKTGAEPESIDDTTGTPQTVVSQYVAGERVAIISKTSFTPKSIISGFTTINAGVTLNSNYNMYYGIVTQAQSLIVDGVEVNAANFLRSDRESKTSYPFKINNSTGLSVGEDAQLNLSIDGTAGVIFHKTTGSNLDIRVNNNGTIKTVIRVDSLERVGINNTNPQESLDVTGNVVASGTIKTTNTTNSTSSSTGAIVVAGGVGVAGNINVGGSLVAPAITIKTALYPDTDTGADIGSADLKFNRIYASRITAGEFYGNVIGTLTGNTIGSASKLASSTTFRLEGDVTSDDITFDGTVGGNVKVFTTALSESYVTDKPEITSILENDEFLISRGTEGLKKIKKNNLWTAILKLPIGGIMPYPAATPPTGWLLCDGSEVKTADYYELFQVIGYTFGDKNSLVGLGTFRLPDFRGRFPLGIDNMNNGITVPSKIDPTKQVQSGGGSANRVTSVEADTLGLGSGSETKILQVSNLPDHEHDLKGNKGNQYYAFRNIAGDPPDTDAISGPGSVSAGLGQYLATSGGILTAGATGQPLNIMNPYLAVNYIIYTGVNA